MFFFGIIQQMLSQNHLANYTKVLADFLLAPQYHVLYNFFEQSKLMLGLGPMRTLTLRKDAMRKV